MPAGTVEGRLVGSHDLAPTIADIGGAQVPGSVDGRSITPLMAGEAVPWRTAILSERVRIGDQTKNGGTLIPGWQMVRGEKSVYIHTNDDPRTDRRGPATEYYKLWRDPYELNNAIGSVSDDLKTHLDQRRKLLVACARNSCRKAENP